MSVNQQTIVTWLVNKRRETCFQAYAVLCVRASEDGRRLVAGDRLHASKAFSSECLLRM